MKDVEVKSVDKQQTSCDTSSLRVLCLGIAFLGQCLPNSNDLDKESILSCHVLSLDVLYII